MVAAEIADMEARDIPFFWVEAGETTIHHRTGPKQRLSGEESARDRTLRDIRSLSQPDIGDQIKVLSDFLDADIQTSANGI